MTSTELCLGKWDQSQLLVRHEPQQSVLEDRRAECVPQRVGLFLRELALGLLERSAAADTGSKLLWNGKVTWRLLRIGRSTFLD